MPTARTGPAEWQDWTDPGFFDEVPDKENRFLPIFLRQLMPARERRTHLTATGWVLILVAMGIGSAAYNTSSNILFLTLSVVLSSLVLSGILSALNFRRLSWELRAPVRLRAGETGMAEVELTNKKTVFPTFSVWFECGTGDGEQTGRLYLRHSLAARASARLEWPFVFGARGERFIRIGGVASRFPFGFLRKQVGAARETSVLVWPARMDYCFDPAATGRRHQAEEAGRARGQGTDLLNIRAYERGDPPRLIHWKASARTGRLMVRQLAEESSKAYRMRVETDAARWRGPRFETLCSLACALAEDLFYAGRLERIEVDDGVSFVLRGVHDLHDFFDYLARAEPVRGAAALSSPAPPNLIRFRPSGERGAAIFLGDHAAGEADA